MASQLESERPKVLRGFFGTARLRLYFGGLLLLQLALIARAVPYVREGSMDYRTLYTAGFMVRTGNASRLYDYSTEARVQNAVVSPSEIALPLMEPACTALLFSPLSLVPYRLSYVLFFLVNLSIIVLCLRIMRHHLHPLADWWKPLAAAIFITFLPVGIALIQGQLSLVLLLAVCASFASLQRGRSFQSGILLSLTLIKFQIALPIAALFLLWRRWGVVAGFLAGGAALACLSVVLTGAHVQTQYLHTLVAMSSDLADSAAQQQNSVYPSHMPNLYGLLHALLPASAHAAATLLASAGLFLWAALQRPSLPLALLVALAVSFHLYLHDLTLLLLPISLVLGQFADAARSADSEGDKPFPSFRNRMALGACFLLLLAPFGRFLIALDQIDLIAIPVLFLAITLNGLGHMPQPGLNSATPPDLNRNNPVEG